MVPSILEPDASLESTQSLLEILEMEPFAADGGWSEDTASIRKLVIKNPERITKNSIYRYFTKLRLLGMGVSAQWYLFFAKLFSCPYLSL